MHIEEFLGQPKTLSDWLQTCREQPGQQYWLLFKDDVAGEEIALTTAMYPMLDDNHLSPQECDALEQSVYDCGYHYFLSLFQLGDVIANLSMQKTAYSQPELLNAVMHYYERDAFIVLE
ncbi:MAG: DUF7716 domain-containing protein [Pseudomonadales bacterium]